jgi:hypothetical protein
MGTEGRFRSSAGTIASIKLSMASMKLSSAGSVHWLVAESLRSNPEIGPTISDRCAGHPVFRRQLRCPPRSWWPICRRADHLSPSHFFLAGIPSAGELQPPALQQRPLAQVRPASAEVPTAAEGEARLPCWQPAVMAAALRA